MELISEDTGQKTAQPIPWKEPKNGINTFFTESSFVRVLGSATLQDKLTKSLDRLGYTETSEPVSTTSRFGTNAAKKKKFSDGHPEDEGRPLMTKRDGGVKRPEKSLRHQQKFWQKKSSLTHAQQKRYLVLLQKYLAMSSIPQQPTQAQMIELVELETLQVKVSHEQNEFMSHLENLAKNAPQGYQRLLSEAKRYIEEKLTNEEKRVEQYPRHYSLLREIPLAEKSDPGHTPVLTFVQTLLDLGPVPKVFLPDMKTPTHPVVPLNYQKINKRFPAVRPKGKKNTWNHEPCSKDQNAEILARKYHCNIVISSSVLKCLVDNHAPSFERDWEIPVVIKQYEEDFGDISTKQRVIYLDKPFAPKHLSARDKNTLYHKYALKAYISQPTQAKKFLSRTHTEKNKVDVSDACNLQGKEPILKGEEISADPFDMGASMDDLETFGTFDNNIPRKKIFLPFNKFEKPQVLGGNNNLIVDEKSEFKMKVKESDITMEVERKCDKTGADTIQTDNDDDGKLGKLNIDLFGADSDEDGDETLISEKPVENITSKTAKVTDTETVREKSFGLDSETLESETLSDESFASPSHKEQRIIEPDESFVPKDYETKICDTGNKGSSVSPDMNKLENDASGQIESTECAVEMTEISGESIVGQSHQKNKVCVSEDDNLKAIKICDMWDEETSSNVSGNKFEDKCSVLNSEIANSSGCETESLEKGCTKVNTEIAEVQLSAEGSTTTHNKVVASTDDEEYLVIDISVDSLKEDIKPEEKEQDSFQEEHFENETCHLQRRRTRLSEKNVLLGESELIISDSSKDQSCRISPRRSRRISDKKIEGAEMCTSRNEKGDMIINSSQVKLPSSPQILKNDQVKPVLTETPGKRRGRPKRSSLEKVENKTEATDDKDDVFQIAKHKSDISADTKNEGVKFPLMEPQEKRRRGRPRKCSLEAVKIQHEGKIPPEEGKASLDAKTTDKVHPCIAEPQEKRRRGRPKKTVLQKSESEAKMPVEKEVRHNIPPEEDIVLNDSEDNQAHSLSAELHDTCRRGRSKKMNLQTEETGIERKFPIEKQTHHGKQKESKNLPETKNSEEVQPPVEEPRRGCPKRKSLEKLEADSGKTASSDNINTAQEEIKALPEVNQSEEIQSASTVCQEKWQRGCPRKCSFEKVETESKTLDDEENVVFKTPKELKILSEAKQNEQVQSYDSEPPEKRRRGRPRKSNLEKALSEFPRNLVHPQESNKSKAISETQVLGDLSHLNDISSQKVEGMSCDNVKSDVKIVPEVPSSETNTKSNQECPQQNISRSQDNLKSVEPESDDSAMDLVIDLPKNDQEEASSPETNTKSKQECLPQNISRSQDNLESVEPESDDSAMDLVIDLPKNDQEESLMSPERGTWKSKRQKSNAKEQCVDICDSSETEVSVRITRSRKSTEINVEQLSETVQTPEEEETVKPCKRNHRRISDDMDVSDDPDILQDVLQVDSDRMVKCDEKNSGLKKGAAEMLFNSVRAGTILVGEDCGTSVSEENQTSTRGVDLAGPGLLLAAGHSRKTAVEPSQAGNKKQESVSQMAKAHFRMSKLQKTGVAPLDSILPLQEKLLHLSRGNEGRPKAEKSTKYIQPEDQNVSYHLWTFSGLTVLVRCCSHGTLRDFRHQMNPVVIVPKLEYQADYGVEQVTISEVAQNWISCYIRPNCRLLRARMNAFTSELIMLEELDLAKILQPSVPFVPQNTLNSLHSIFVRLSELPVGHYLLSHTKGESQCCIKKNVANNKRGTYDLRYSSIGFSALGDSLKSTVPWIPIDATVILPHHMKNGRIPATYQPKDYSTVRHFSDKKGKKKRNRKKKNKMQSKLKK